MTWLAEEGFSDLTRADEFAEPRYSSASEYRQRHVLWELRALRGKR
jgi:hypothetical protein